MGPDGSRLSYAVKRALVTLQIWRERVRQRRELAQWTDHDLHDVGLSWSDIALEIKKSFWRASMALEALAGTTACLWQPVASSDR